MARLKSIFSSCIVFSYQPQLLLAGKQVITTKALAVNPAKSLSMYMGPGIRERRYAFAPPVSLPGPQSLPGYWDSELIRSRDVWY